MNIRHKRRIIIHVIYPPLPTAYPLSYFAAHIKACAKSPLAWGETMVEVCRILCRSIELFHEGIVRVRLLISAHPDHTRAYPSRRPRGKYLPRNKLFYSLHNRSRGFVMHKLSRISINLPIDSPNLRSLVPPFPTHMLMGNLVLPRKNLGH